MPTEQKGKWPSTMNKENGKMRGQNSEQNFRVQSLKFGFYSTCNGKLLKRPWAMCHVMMICF